MAGLRIEDLWKSYGDTPVLEDISLSVDDGEFCILLGPSGCGKTTLLRVIAGLEAADRGVVGIGDRDASRLSPQERNVAMVFQSYALYPHMNVFDNLAFPLRARKTPRGEIPARVRSAAELLGIAELLGRRPRELSGGQRQRVAIGRALVREPSLFLFDEPLSNLDAKLRGGMRVELAKLHRKLKATMVYVTHDQVEAMTLGEKIVVLHEGRIQQIGSPEEIYGRPCNTFVASFVGSPPINLIDGSLRRENGRTMFCAPGLQTELHGAPRAADVSGPEFTLGVRPEAVKLGEGPNSGELDVVEKLGAETLYYLNTKSGQLVARASAPSRFPAGKTVPFRFRASGVHLFRDHRRVDFSPRDAGETPGVAGSD